MKIVIKKKTKSPRSALIGEEYNEGERRFAECGIAAYSSRLLISMDTRSEVGDRMVY